MKSEVKKLKKTLPKERRAKPENKNLCKNCDTVFNGNFCPNCSQSASTRRIDAQYILHDIPHSVLHIDKGLPYTFFRLSVNPGKALLD